ncbi:helix-turn-helix domain-containing protein [Nonomuraea sp. NPDC050556]|uniref:helix-turn-helix domain-containing protein n=1 Tax=Nonomuraea sp. NPDC050556 TaxID=3364369 RepID=UPI0037B3F04B
MKSRDDSALAEIFDGPGEMDEIRRQASLLRAGLRLGEVRKRLGLTQQQVADRMEVSQKRVSAIETAQLSTIKVSTLVAYAEALGGKLGVSIDVDDEHLELAAGATDA